MPLDLEKLQFQVDTSALLNAKKAVDELSKTMGKLNKVTEQDAKTALLAAKAKETEAKTNAALARQREIEIKAALTSAKINESNTRVRLAEEAAARKVTEQLERKAQAEERSALAAEKAKQREIAAAERAAEKQAAAARKIVEQLEKKAQAEEKARLAAEKAAAAEASKISVLERQQNILSYMTQGYSKGQASVLAYAQASGAATNEIRELGNVLEIQRKLMGASPFDKSMSGLTALKNQYGEVREAIRQYNADSGLTANQTRELARDKERIIEKLKQEGAGLTQIKQAIREYNSAYIDTATKVNTLSKAEKDRERTMRDTANAIRNIQAAEERLFATVSHLGDIQSNNIKVNERAVLALGSYERNLRLAGISGEQAATKLAKFKAAQERVSEAEAKNRANYVARGVGVQLGDVGVSLASGMNPLTVAIQQGDQLRGLIQQSGLEATQMAGVMQQAFKGIITSFKDVGTAMGAFVLGGITTVGKSASDVALKMTGFSFAVKALRKDFVDLQNTSAGPVLPDFKTKLADFIEAMLQSRAAALLFGTALFGVVGILGTAVIAYFKTTSAIDSMNETLVLHGARLNTTREDLIKLSEASAGVTSSSNDMKAFFAELIKGGFSSKESLLNVASAARELASVTSLSLTDIAKLYTDLAKDPVNALIKLGTETGNVTVETIKHVEELKKQGKEVEAVMFAIDAMANSHRKSAKEIENSLSPISAILIGLKGLWNDVKNAAIDAGNATATAFLYVGKKALELNSLRQEAVANRKFVSGEINREQFDAEIANIQKEKELYTTRYKNATEGNAQIQDGTKAFNAEQIRLEQLRIKAMESFQKQDDIISTKRVSRAEYVAKKLRELSASMGNQPVVGRDFTLAVSAFEKEWNDANKKDKVKSPVSTNLRNELDDFKRYQKEEEDIYKSRLSTLKYFYEQGYYTVEDYFSREQNAIQDNLDNQRKSVDERLKILETYKAKTKTPKDEADLQGKINALLDERNKIEREGNQLISESNQKRILELLAYKKMLSDVNIEVLALQKNYEEAAKERASMQYDERITRAERSDPALAEQLKFLKQYQIEKGKVDQLNSNFSTINTELQNKEARITNQRTAGTLGEIEALSQLGEARQEAYDKMKAMVDAYDAYLAMDPSKMTDAQRQSFALLAPEIDKVKLSMETLGVSMSPLAAKFKDLFTDSFSNAFSDFVMGSKSASEAFSSFAQSVIREMMNIAARQAALKLVGLFSSLFSPVSTTSYASSSAATAPGYTAGTLGSGIRLSANGNAFTPTGIVHAFANGGSFTNSVVNKPTPFMFANGGALGVMGEAGPEAILPLQRTSSGKLGVISSSGNDAPINVVVNVTVASDGSSKTENNSSTYGKEFGNAIASVVRSEIIKEKRNGGLLASTK